MERLGLTDSFVNIVNLDDPVPRLLNLTESLAQLCRSGSELSRNLGDAADNVKQVVSCLMGSEGVVTLLTTFSMTTVLSSRLKGLMEHPASSRLAKMVDVYSQSASTFSLSRLMVTHTSALGQRASMSSGIWDQPNF